MELKQGDCVVPRNEIQYDLLIRVIRAVGIRLGMNPKDWDSFRTTHNFIQVNAYSRELQIAFIRSEIDESIDHVHTVGEFIDKLLRFKKVNTLQLSSTTKVELGDKILAYHGYDTPNPTKYLISKEDIEIFEQLRIVNYYMLYTHEDAWEALKYLAAKSGWKQDVGKHGKYITIHTQKKVIFRTDFPFEPTSKSAKRVSIDVFMERITSPVPTLYRGHAVKIDDEYITVGCVQIKKQHIDEIISYYYEQIKT